MDNDELLQAIKQKVTARKQKTIYETLEIPKETRKAWYNRGKSLNKKHREKLLDYLLSEQ